MKGSTHVRWFVGNLEETLQPHGQPLKEEQIDGIINPILQKLDYPKLCCSSMEVVDDQDNVFFSIELTENGYEVIPTLKGLESYTLDEYDREVRGEVI